MTHPATAGIKKNKGIFTYVIWDSHMDDICMSHSSITKISDLQILTYLYNLSRDNFFSRRTAMHRTMSLVTFQLLSKAKETFL
jgi:hypothetical protein